MKVLTANSKWFDKSDIRLDASFHLSPGRLTKILLNKCPYGLTTIEKVSSSIFYGGRARRTYVNSEENGIPFIGSADMLKCSFEGLKHISKKITKNLNNLFVKNEWILVSRSGTIGNTVFVNDDFRGKGASEHIIRIVPNNEMTPGIIYSFLSSKYGYSLMTQGVFGAVIQHIEPEFLANLPIPKFPDALQEKAHLKIIEASSLLVEANELLINAQDFLMNSVALPPLSSEEYEYFGYHSADRKLSAFSISSSEISPVSINAFNYSRRIKALHKRVESATKGVSLADVLETPGFFSTGSFPRVELNSPKAITLINQTDIFNIRKVGKQISPRKVKTDRLVSYGEVMIAGVGTLGENETFCRTIFAGEELEGQLVSGEFIRMKTKKGIPSGYLYAWLSSDYGFRFIRSTQTGTKLCRPIPALLKNIPVPLLEENEMKKIDAMVKKAHTKRFEALKKEDEAISMVENEISSWQK